MTFTSVGTSFPLGLSLSLAPEGPKRFVFGFKDVGLCQVQCSLQTLTTISWLPEQAAECLCARRTRSGADGPLCLQLLACDLQASWDSKASLLNHSLFFEWGKGTWPCNSIYFNTRLYVGGPSPFAETQWLHQTLHTHILSCLIGKAIKHESSGLHGCAWYIFLFPHRFPYIYSFFFLPENCENFSFFIF